ncbi:MAG: hypothetical protein JAY82_18250 [Candidatus Thiodiazotropha taylori]|nr:hypothetical protein [Candidatus Thiodiazotropha taylori]
MRYGGKIYHETPEEKRTRLAFIAIKVDDYSVRADAGINASLLGSPRFVDNEEEPVHEFETKLEITGLCSEPEDRAGHRFMISMYGAADIDQRTPLIKDLREHNKEGENRWITWLWVTPCMVTDSLIILSGSKPVYISLHEIKEGRKRRVQSLTVQTTDPAEE